MAMPEIPAYDTQNADDIDISFEIGDQKIWLGDDYCTIEIIKNGKSQFLISTPKERFYNFMREEFAKTD
ncbi:hypothetical protein [Mucilaginibacter ginsenosidivorans]|uniref:Uncharacterized protein n=1 Tax=Mucilaginibacter ginsenosidivorans TaxID=398053 RepID=A0A5B8UXC6_9SPHI|nr:hypothetical protein [Mucilaginibacter ginsenosidivorans]QEC63704.1 hypothetical protein FRZ54_14345 [Mucilaginibacter ginsenosidivorans]